MSERNRKGRPVREPATGRSVSAEALAGGGAVEGDDGSEASIPVISAVQTRPDAGAFPVRTRTLDVVATPRGDRSDSLLSPLDTPAADGHVSGDNSPVGWSRTACG